MVIALLIVVFLIVGTFVGIRSAGRMGTKAAIWYGWTAIAFLSIFTFIIMKNASTAIFLTLLAVAAGHNLGAILHRPKPLHSRLSERRVRERCHQSYKLADYGDKGERIARYLQKYPAATRAELVLAADLRASPLIPELCPQCHGPGAKDLLRTAIKAAEENYPDANKPDASNGK
jgi:hypothetical protein